MQQQNLNFSALVHMFAFWVFKLKIIKTFSEGYSLLQGSQS